MDRKMDNNFLNAVILNSSINSQLAIANSKNNQSSWDDVHDDALEKVKEIEMDKYNKVRIKLPNGETLVKQLSAKTVDRKGNADVIKFNFEFSLSLGGEILVDIVNNAGLHSEVAEVLSDVTSATINVSEKMYVISNDEMDYNNDDGSFGRSKIYRSDAESSLIKFSDIKIKSDSLSAYNNVLELLNDKEVQSVIEGYLLMKSSIDVSTVRVKEIIKL